VNPVIPAVLRVLQDHWVLVVQLAPQVNEDFAVVQVPLVHKVNPVIQVVLQVLQVA
jgi:hypothetical protein